MSGERTTTGHAGPTAADPLAALKFLQDKAEKLWDEWSNKRERADILIAGKTGRREDVTNAMRSDWQSS